MKKNLKVMSLWTNLLSKTIKEGWFTDLEKKSRSGCDVNDVIMLPFVTWIRKKRKQSKSSLPFLIIIELEKEEGKRGNVSTFLASKHQWQISFVAFYWRGTMKNIDWMNISLIWTFTSTWQAVWNFIVFSNKNVKNSEEKEKYKQKVEFIHDNVI